MSAHVHRNYFYRSPLGCSRAGTNGQLLDIPRPQPSESIRTIADTMVRPIVVHRTTTLGAQGTPIAFATDNILRDIGPVMTVFAQSSPSVVTWPALTSDPVSVLACQDPAHG